MHEARLVRDLIREATRVAEAEGAARVESIHIEIGGASHVTPDSLTGQFELLSSDTPLEHSRLIVERPTDPAGRTSHDIRLVSIEIPEG